MKALLTGASSFTGFWFAQELSARGFEVVAPLRGRASAYEGVRAKRVEGLSRHAAIVEDCAFGSAPFIELVARGGFSVICHHAAEVTNYRSPDFDVEKAVAGNTYNLRRVLETAKTNGLRAIVATGSVFEQDEGIGDPPHRAFSPYGLSKGLTWEVIRYWCTVLGIPAGKFVIGNPFGPFEEPRLGAYLIDQWKAGKAAEIRTPLYLRDNIHVDLLAKSYAQFVHTIADTGRDGRIGISGYRETQGAFAERLAAEMRPRLEIACEVVLARQTDFSEPMVRLNTDVPDAAALGWTEVAAWDGLAQFYRERLAAG